MSILIRFLTTLLWLMVSVSWGYVVGPNRRGINNIPAVQVDGKVGNSLQMDKIEPKSLMPPMPSIKPVNVTSPTAGTPMNTVTPNSPAATNVIPEVNRNIASSPPSTVGTNGIPDPTKHAASPRTTTPSIVGTNVIPDPNKNTASTLPSTVGKNSISVNRNIASNPPSVGGKTAIPERSKNIGSTLLSTPVTNMIPGLNKYITSGPPPSTVGTSGIPDVAKNAAPGTNLMLGATNEIAPTPKENENKNLNTGFGSRSSPPAGPTSTPKENPKSLNQSSKDPAENVNSSMQEASGGQGTPIDKVKQILTSEKQKQFDQSLKDTKNGGANKNTS